MTNSCFRWQSVPCLWTCDDWYEFSKRPITTLTLSLVGSATIDNTVVVNLHWSGVDYSAASTVYSGSGYIVKFRTAHSDGVSDIDTSLNYHEHSSWCHWGKGRPKNHTWKRNLEKEMLTAWYKWKAVRRWRRQHRTELNMEKNGLWWPHTGNGHMSLNYSTESLVNVIFICPQQL